MTKATSTPRPSQDSLARILDVIQKRAQSIYDLPELGDIEEAERPRDQAAPDELSLSQ